MYKRFQAETQQFYQQTKQAFGFLETEYKFQWLDEYVESDHYFPDMTAYVRYASEKVGVQIPWSLSGSAINVSFVQLQQQFIFPPIAEIADVSNLQKGIIHFANIYSIAGVLGHADDPLLMLGNIDDTLKEFLRRRKIAKHMDQVLEGLALAVRKYAVPVLQGDTAIFPEAYRYYEEKRRQERK